MSEQLATFAGGCFWCIEAAFSQIEGVSRVASGYAGGSKTETGYYQVGSGKTGHREAVQITYDPDTISYQKLLDIYWLQINPTDPGGQFADRGQQYTTAIYYHTAEQKQLAQTSKQTKDTSGLYDEPIVTEIVPYTTFFPAEDYHQDYSKKHPLAYQSYAFLSGRKPYIARMKHRLQQTS